MEYKDYRNRKKAEETKGRKKKVPLEESLRLGPSRLKVSEDVMRVTIPLDEEGNIDPNSSCNTWRTISEFDIERKTTLNIQISEKLLADFLIRLSFEGFGNMRQFFEGVIVLLLSQDSYFIEALKNLKRQLYEDTGKIVFSPERQKLLDKQVKRALEKTHEFGLDEEEKINIFDILEKDLTDL